jgi:hypothetical protein
MGPGAQMADDCEQMFRRFAATVAVGMGLLGLASPASALAGGGDYAFHGASASERATVRAALEASSFDWGVVEERITIHVGRVGTSHATPGHIWLDRRLLATGRFAWPTIMDEYAHQVDFFVLDADRRSVLQQRLGASAWCYEVDGVEHSANGCERFSSMLAWAYWPSRDSAYRPRSSACESASMPAAEFRRLVAGLVGVSYALKKP